MDSILVQNKDNPVTAKVSCSEGHLDSCELEIATALSGSIGQLASQSEHLVFYTLDAEDASRFVGNH